MGSYASLSVCLSVCEKNAWKLIHISETVRPRVTKFGKGMDVDDPKDDLEGQGHRSKVKVTKSKNITSGLVWRYDM